MKTIPFLAIALLSASAHGAGKVNGACGTAGGVAVTSAPTSGLCSSGSATAVTGTGPWHWQCKGSHGGTNANCSAPLLVRSLSLSVTPASPSISPNSAVGSVVAILQGVWSDGSQFTGSFVFTSPYFDDGQLFTIVGDQLILNQSAAQLGNTSQNVTIEAVQ